MPVRLTVSSPRLQELDHIVAALKDLKIPADLMHLEPGLLVIDCKDSSYGHWLAGGITFMTGCSVDIVSYKA